MKTIGYHRNPDPEDESGSVEPVGCIVGLAELEAALTNAEFAFEKLRDEHSGRQSWQAWHAIGALRGWCESERGILLTVPVSDGANKI